METNKLKNGVTSIILWTIICFGLMTISIDLIIEEILVNNMSETNMVYPIFIPNPLKLYLAIGIMLFSFIILVVRINKTNSLINQ